VSSDQHIVNENITAKRKSALQHSLDKGVRSAKYSCTSALFQRPQFKSPRPQKICDTHPLCIYIICKSKLIDVAFITS